MSDLLTLDDIAAMWKCNRRHARDVLVKLAEFPPTAPGSTTKNPVWLRSEVRAYANRKPKLPAQIPQHTPQPA
jgi:hypothetical protein